MADGISVYLEKKVLDHVFGNTVYTAPATIYAAALTTMPTDRSGTGIAEVANANNYSRVALTNNVTNFTNATGTTTGIKATGVTITFAVPSGTWGTVLGLAFVDSGTYGAGNWLGFLTFSGGGTVINNANTLTVVSSNLTLQ